MTPLNDRFDIVSHVEGVPLIVEPVSDDDATSGYRGPMDLTPINMVLLDVLGPSLSRSNSLFINVSGGGGGGIVQ
jgi:hypothetical protein